MPYLLRSRICWMNSMTSKVYQQLQFGLRDNIHLPLWLLIHDCMLMPEKVMMSYNESDLFS